MSLHQFICCGIKIKPYIISDYKDIESIYITEESNGKEHIKIEEAFTFNI